MYSHDTCTKRAQAEHGTIAKGRSDPHVFTRQFVSPGPQQAYAMKNH
jgi:hypothetical protein